MVRCLYVTLGCAKNEVDTDRMRALLERAGVEEANTVEEADVALVNTCSFLVAATQESIETTLELAAAARDGLRRLPIVMCGCVPSRYGSAIADEMSEVAAFVPADEEDGIVEVVAEVLGLDLVVVDGARRMLRTVEASYAFVKISDGCDRFCTFCAIPYIRGRYASRPADEILEEVTGLLEGGVREVVLVGQDTGVWGSDLGQGYDLAWLLRAVAAVCEPYGAWVRVLYLQPEGMTDDLIGALGEGSAILPYLDMPIQHCNGRILAEMGRAGDAASLKELFSRLRREVPDLEVRTTAMAGFPGETDEEAAELVRFIADLEPDYTSVFGYSAEEGTVAAGLTGQVAEEVILERTQELTDLAEALGFASTAARVGTVADVLIDGIGETDEGFELIGHAWFQAPDTDGCVHIECGEASVGDIVTCRFVDSFCYELVGVIV